MIPKDVLAKAQLIWDYHHLNHSIKKADCIFALGSHDTRVADRAIELYSEGLAPCIIFSGGLGNLTEGVWDEPEADLFAKIAMEKGVPDSHIIIENKSTNTGENIRFSHQLMLDKIGEPKKMILVQKPYMERRTYATFMKQWPGTVPQIMVTSPQISFEEYSTEEITLEQVIHIMVGDLQRIIEYPAKGFQIEQEVPGEVMEAYFELLELGYRNHMAN